VEAPPLDSPCDGPVTYPGDIKHSENPQKEEEELQTELPKRKIDIAIITETLL